MNDRPRCNTCNGIIKVGRPCKRCANAQARHLEAIEREDRAERDRQRQVQESAAISASRRVHLSMYVRAFLAQPHGERCAWADRNPLVMW